MAHASIKQTATLLQASWVLAIVPCLAIGVSDSRGESSEAEGTSASAFAHSTEQEREQPSVLGGLYGQRMLIEGLVRKPTHKLDQDGFEIVVDRIDTVPLQEPRVIIVEPASSAWRSILAQEENEPVPGQRYELRGFEFGEWFGGQPAEVAGLVYATVGRHFRRVFRVTSGFRLIPGEPRGVPLATPNVQVSDGDRQLISIVLRDFGKWDRVRPNPEWVMTLCMQPSSVYLRDLRQSEAGVTSPHGRKLYYLHALRRWTYLEAIQKEKPLYQAADGGAPVARSLYAEYGASETPASSVPSGVRQVLVKDSFHPVEIHGITDQSQLPYAGPRPNPGVAEVDEYGARRRYFSAGLPYGQFIMIQYDTSTPPLTGGKPLEQTDAGWLYATVNPAGELSSFGKIESCMQCHENSLHAAPNNRLLGRLTGEPRPGNLQPTKDDLIEGRWLPWQPVAPRE